MSEKDLGPIFFMKTRDPWGEFSNMHPTPIFYQGREWPTVEHAYQASKFLRIDSREKIRACASPMAAAYEGRRLPDMREDWDIVREPIMDMMLALKTAQHASIRALLQSTGNRLIVELSYKDPYWGSREDLSGLNRLGVKWMQRRDYYRSVFPDQYPIPSE